MTSEAPRATLLPPTAQSASAARAFARETLDQWRLMTSYDDLALVVSELVTNALIHAAGTITVELHRLDHTVRVVVADDCSALPIELPRDVDRESGRGLEMVAAFARDWGTDARADGGKAVWADLTIQPPNGSTVISI